MGTKCGNVNSLVEKPHECRYLEHDDRQGMFTQHTRWLGGHIPRILLGIKIRTYQYKAAYFKIGGYFDCINIHLAGRSRLSTLAHM